jgi:ribose 5-phosphate isomerase A
MTQLAPKECKQNAAKEAAKLVQSGMKVGLGTGSTVAFLLEELGAKISAGLEIEAVATSKQTEELATNQGIPITDFYHLDRLDITIDGADEIDPEMHLIKGGGGALLREKIVACASDRVVIIADESKSVEELGQFPLPVEVVPFGWQVTMEAVKKHCPQVHLRKKEQHPLVTDNGNYILDCFCEHIAEPARLEGALKQLTGVVEVGLFVGVASEVILGKTDGTVQKL